MREVLQEKYYPKRSSLVEYLIYDYPTRRLQVKYKQGKKKDRLRSYDNFSADDFNQIVHAQSTGKTLLKILRKHKKENSWVNRIMAFLKNY